MRIAAVQFKKTDIFRSTVNSSGVNRSGFYVWHPFLGGVVDGMPPTVTLLHTLFTVLRYRNIKYNSSEFPSLARDD